MADPKKEKSEGGFFEKIDKDVIILVAFLGGIILLWFLSGGMYRDTARSGIFIKPLAPVDSGATYGGKYLLAKDTEKESLSIPKTFDFSFLKNWATKERATLTQPEQVQPSVTPKTIVGPFTEDLMIDGVVGARKSNPDDEYIRIVPNPTPSRLGPWNVSDLVVKSDVTGKQETIPEAALLPILGEVPELIKVAIGRREAVILTTGDSPIGTSFKVNSCSGYLEQFQDYAPSLRSECPLAIEEIDSSGLGEDMDCVEFAKTIPRCTAFIETFPKNISGECRAFITKTLTYNGCVMKHKNDSNFYKDEWRLFLEKSTEMWKNRSEIIKLIDRNGDVVDAVTY